MGRPYERVRAQAILGLNAYIKDRLIGALCKGAAKVRTTPGLCALPGKSS